MDYSDPGLLLLLALTLLFVGAVIGFLAGLFGIGGGAIAVPAFHEVFILLGNPPEIAMPLAVGTSLAVMVPTSVNSTRQHFRRGTVDMGILRAWALPVLAGVILGAIIARYAPPMVFKIAFILVAAAIAIKLLTGFGSQSMQDSLPGRWVMRAYGAVIGLLSALMGIGGGALATMVLTLHNVPIHRAVSTSAGMGALISIPGALGFVIAGWGQPGLPPYAIGYVSWAAFLLTVPASLVTTRYGVRLAHALSRRKLEVGLGLYLILVSLRFLALLFVD